MTALPASPQSMFGYAAILLLLLLHALMHWHISQHASEKGWMRGGRVEKGVKRRMTDNKVKDGGEVNADLGLSLHVT